MEKEWLSPVCLFLCKCEAQIATSVVNSLQHNERRVGLIRQWSGEVTWFPEKGAHTQLLSSQISGLYICPVVTVLVGSAGVH